MRKAVHAFTALVVLVTASGVAEGQLACPPGAPALLAVVYTAQGGSSSPPVRRVVRVGAQLCRDGGLLTTASTPEHALPDITSPADDPFPISVTVARGSADPADLQLLRAALANAGVARLRNCRFTGGSLQARFTWFGRGRSNTFIVTSVEPALPECSPAANALIDAWFAVQAGGSYPDRVVFGP